MNTSMTDKVYIGPETGVRLDRTDCLTLPPAREAGGFLRPGMNRELLRMSAELAGATYSLDLENWLNAGWQDVSVEVDELLMGGIQGQREDPWVQITNAAKLDLLRARINRRDPLSEAIGTLKGLRVSDTVKAVVMMHEAAEGRWVLAISFMGTTQRLADWLSNLRMSTDQGWHQGFLQLTEQFEAREGLIAFPETARRLGMSRLTLRDVLEECAGEDSRFRIWLSGHSQGAAVMQIWAARRMAAGVRAENMVGVGLASPTVCRAETVRDPAEYPLYHVLSTDDVVPKMGSQKHLGLCLFFRADEELRKTCYAWPRDEQAVAERMQARRILSRMQNTGRCIETVIALLCALKTTADPTRLGAIGLLNPDWSMYKLLTQAEEDTLSTLLNTLIRMCYAAGVSITGQPLNGARIAEDERVIWEVFHTIGAEATLKTMADIALNAHTALAPQGARQGVYPYIVNQREDRLVKAVWNRGEPPRLLLYKG
ncbi:MAG: hypothetical protein IKP40_06465 [Clostridia bacterium]|nr:hypothetical protein [Clostridia bacterium]